MGLISDLKSNKRVFTNTFMLYILTGSNYIFSFITFPYLTRVLQKDAYGKVAFVSTFMLYFQLIIEFGFILSATEEVSKNREDRNKISSILSNVTLNKLLLSVLGLAILLPIIIFIPAFQGNNLFYIFFYLYTVMNTILPDFLFRGLEKMSVISVRTVIVRAIFLVLIFIFVKKPSDYILVPVFYLAGSVVANIIAWRYVYKNMDISFARPVGKDCIREFKRSSRFFLSRAAATVYSASNSFLLGLKYGKTTSGYYAAGDKYVSTAMSAATPVSDSLYPHMVIKKDFKIVKTFLLILTPCFILLSVFMFIFAGQIVSTVSGNDYTESSAVLRGLSPIVAVILPQYVLGFPVLGALGQSKRANDSVVIASVFHMAGLAVLFFTGNFSLVNVAVLTTCSEVLTLLIRIVMVKKYYTLYKQNPIQPVP